MDEQHVTSDQDKTEAFVHSNSCCWPPLSSSGLSKIYSRIARDFDIVLMRSVHHLNIQHEEKTL